MKIQPLSEYLQALQQQEYRGRILAANIANADTPNYKARDVQFSDRLNSARADALRLSTTNVGHQQQSGSIVSEQAVGYRVPTQATLDGNTVETDVEQAAYAENTLRYRATLSFLDGQIRSLRYAIKGGD